MSDPFVRLTKRHIDGLPTRDNWPHHVFEGKAFLRMRGGLRLLVAMPCADPTKLRWTGWDVKVVDGGAWLPKVVRDAMMAYATQWPNSAPWGPHNWCHDLNGSSHTFEMRRMLNWWQWNPYERTEGHYNPFAFPRRGLEAGPVDSPELSADVIPEPTPAAAPASDYAKPPPLQAVLRRDDDTSRPTSASGDPL